MHELALCQAIADTAQARAGGRRVVRVDVRIGHLRQVVPDALQFSWQLLTDGSELEGAELAVDHVPAVIECRPCGTSTTLDAPVLLCGHCSSADVAIVSGEELLVVSLERAQAVR